MNQRNRNMMKTIHKIAPLVLPVAVLQLTSLQGALIDLDFEDAAVGTLTAETHPGWTGMLAGNETGSSIDDWKIVEGAGLDWVAEDGGTIDGGNRHFEMRSVSNKTGRAFYDFDALPTDIGEATSIYLRYAVAFDAFENIADPAAAWTVWPLIRFNASWQMRSILKFNHNDWRPEKDEERFFAELHNDKEPSSTNTVVFLEEKLGAPQVSTTYLVVTRYDFNDIGDLTGQAIWVNPNFADSGTPDLISEHAPEAYYSTFLDPIVSMDITTYGGTMRYDNIKIASAWEDVVPAASGGATWAGFPLDESGNADTGDWMGYVNVVGDWVWSYSLASWIYLPEGNVSEQGAWMYVTR